MNDDSASAGSDAKCGSYAGAAQHRRWGQVMCPACREAHNEYHRQWDAAHPEHRHPTRQHRINVCVVCGGALADHIPFGPCYRAVVHP